MLDFNDPYSSVGLLSEEDRARASKLGWLNAAANLFDASAPQVGGQQKTPFQLLGTGLRGYAQGTQESTDRIAQERAYQRKLEDEQKRKDWAANISGKLDQYGISQDVATGMSPESIAKMIVDAEDDKRKYAQQEKLYDMMTKRQLETQGAIADRTSASQAALFERQQEAEKARLEREKELLNLRLRSEGRTVGSDGNIYSTKPLPATIAKMQDEAIGDLGSSVGVQKDIEHFSKQIDDKKLNLGPLNNAVNWAQNAAGLSDEGSRNYASFKASLEAMRNNSLRLNKGVQTEGDAVRAWNELFDNLNDPKVVKQRLGEIKGINERAASLKKLQIDRLREEYNKPPMDYSVVENLSSAYDQSPKNSNGGGIKFMGFE